VPTEPAATRRALHALAEQVLAGPQHRRSGTIRLRVSMGTIHTVAEPDVQLTATQIVGPMGMATPTGNSCAALAAAIGVDIGAPRDVYTDVTGVDPDETLTVDHRAAAALLEAFWRGEQALRRLAAGETPVLWPEHFDLGISLDEVNYGVSPGDGYLDEPYAYVGPWTPHTGAFFNAPFGAARPLRDLPGVALEEFLIEGRRQTAS
jgi:hypothetical protein